MSTNSAKDGQSVVEELFVAMDSENDGTLSALSAKTGSTMLYIDGALVATMDANTS